MKGMISVMEKKKSILPVVSLALGIISIVLFGFWYVTLPAGILALVFGGKAVKKLGSKLAKAGIITAIVGLSLFLLYYGAAIILIFLGEF